MRAVRYEEFGPAEVLHVVDLEVPAVTPEAVLVRVAAAAVGGGETAIRAGKLQAVLPLRPPAGVGTDFTGHVTAVGDRVTRFREGDAVWGLMPHLTFGGAAEYVAVPEDRLAAAPAGVSLIEAAALPSSGTTAVTALTDKVRLAAGQRLLVRGAAGGVGNVAVQLGRALGAHVTALVSARDLDWIRQLGADEAYDYRTTRAAGLGPFDVILDLVGNDLEAYAATLATDGQLIALAFDPDQLAVLTEFLTKSDLARAGRIVSFSNDPSPERLAELTAHVGSGAIRPIVDTVYPLASTAAAHRRLEAGGVHGKLVIAVTTEADRP